jgi:hypothetical protein
MIIWGSALMAGLLLILMLFACGPREGTLMYGVCKVFLERYVKYPQTLQIRFVEQYRMAVRIGYNSVDPFGQYTHHMMECNFKPDAETGLTTDSILLDRKELPAELIQDFNKGLVAVLQNPPDLTLPPPLAVDLVDLRDR